LDNDGHDTGVAFAGTYLTNFFAGKTFPAKTLIVVTFDEDDFSQNNQIYTLVKGDFITAGTNNINYNHFSMLRTIEDNWNLGNLGQGDASAAAITLQPVSVPTAPVAPPPPTTAAPIQSSTSQPTAPIAPQIVNVTWAFIDGRVRTTSDVTNICRGGLRNTTVFTVREGFKRKRDQEETVAVMQGNDTWTAAIISTDSTTTNQQEANKYASPIHCFHCFFFLLEFFFFWFLCFDSFYLLFFFHSFLVLTISLALYLSSNAFTNVIAPSTVTVNGARPDTTNRGAVIAVAVILSLVAIVLIILIIATIVYFKKKKSTEKEDYSMY
jgi:hypothetical protein